MILWKESGRDLTDPLGMLVDVLKYLGHPASETDLILALIIKPFLYFYILDLD